MRTSNFISSYPHNPQIVLASASPERRALLTEAGITFTTRVPRVKEKVIKDRHPDMPTADIAMLLAMAKAQEVAAYHPSAFVIGCDQTMHLDGVVFNKPETLDDVRAVVTALSGRESVLYTAAVIMQGKRLVWARTDTNRLTMRALSADEIDTYVREKGLDAIGCLGGVKVEENLDLFDQIKGDIASIRGLPMKHLIHFLNKSNKPATEE